MRVLTLTAVGSVAVLGGVVAWTAMHGPVAPDAPASSTVAALTASPATAGRASWPTVVSVDPARDSAPEALEAAAPDPVAPEPVALPDLSLDVVRVAPDGQIVIAGRGTPGSSVDLLIDDTVVDTLVADRRTGDFATVVFEAPATDARTVQLRTADPVASLPIPTAGGSAELAYADPASTAPSGVPNGGIVSVTTRAATVAPTLQAPGLVSASDPVTIAPRVAETDAPSPAGVEPARVRPVVGLATLVPSDDAPVIERVDRSDAVPAPVSPNAAPGLPDRSARAVETVTALAAEPAAPTTARIYSAPVVILPASREDSAPTVIRADETEVAVLQPEPLRHERVALDRVTYSQAGEIELAGRAAPGREVRIYVDAMFQVSATAKADGMWSADLPRAVAEPAMLLRFDEIADDGAVTSRVEAPFMYDPQSTQIVRAKSITVTRGDNLWRIAEAHYGRGLRYSVIFDANAALIRDPDLIYPGQVFEVPEIVPEN